MTLLKINRLLPIYISIVPLKFEVDIQSQSTVRVRKPKNPIWPPGVHFESDIAENQQASAYGHHQHAYEIWNWSSKANLTYAPETISSTDRRTDRRTDGQGESSIPPFNFVGRGYNDGYFSWLPKCAISSLWHAELSLVVLDNMHRCFGYKKRSVTMLYNPKLWWYLYMVSEHMKNRLTQCCIMRNFRWISKTDDKPW